MGVGESRRAVREARESNKRSFLTGRLGAGGAATVCLMAGAKVSRSATSRAAVEEASRAQEVRDAPVRPGRSQTATVAPPRLPSAPEAPKSTGGRIVALDAVRGAMLLVSVGVDSWVNVPTWFNHAVWVGIHPMDYIFPIFVTMSGCGFGLAFADTRRVRVRPIVQRIVILCSVGLVYNAIAASGSPWGVPFRFATLRFPGVLQLYAAVTAAIALLHLVVKGWKRWAALTVSLAVVYTAILGGWSAHCGGHLTTSCNPSHTIDYAVFGANHLFLIGQLGYDPEGLPSILGALVTASMGATIGHLIRELRGRSRADIVRAGAAVIVGGLVLSELLALVVPAFKNQWTPPFDLLLASAAATMLLAGHLLLDRNPRVRRAQLETRFPVWVLVALGRNSLFVYFGSHALTSWLGAHTHGGRSDLVRLEQAISLGGHPQATLTVAIELLWVSLAAFLHWRKIYLRP